MNSNIHNKEIICKKGFDFLKFWFNKIKEYNIYQIKAKESLKDLRKFEEDFLMSNSNDQEKIIEKIFDNYDFKSNDDEIICKEIKFGFNEEDNSMFFKENIDGEFINKNQWVISYYTKNRKKEETVSLKWFFETYLFSGKFKFFPKD